MLEQSKVQLDNKAQLVQPELKAMLPVQQVHRVQLAQQAVQEQQDLEQLVTQGLLVLPDQAEQVVLEQPVLPDLQEHKVLLVLPDQAEQVVLAQPDLQVYKVLLVTQVQQEQQARVE